MRLSARVIGLPVVLVAALTAGSDAARTQTPPKTDNQKIANAMSAAPPAISHTASVAEMAEDGSMKMLRKGTGAWTCVPDDPSTPGNDPMCLDPNAMEWLHALLTKAPPPDKVGFIYMLKGGSAGTRPHAPLQSHTSVIRGLRRCCLVPVLFNSRCSDHGANVDVVPTPSCCLTASTSPSTQISVI